MKAIRVDNLSKKFVLRHDRPRNLADGLRTLLFRRRREDFWALKDVSFDVEQGEALGIIGHNGAGKSTVLKILTGIMKPTSGRVLTRGRVSALIEVGAGFHPEMTGRENIYLNGTILGMTRAEIGRKLDAIIDFAEIEPFIDTPVKRYSSGMYARLGFAVLAHVDPDVLLVDEVLSVGDEAFQVKCQKRMSELMLSGTTVVFISHNLPLVVALCPRTLVLDHGRVVFDGESSEAVRLARRLLPGASRSGNAEQMTSNAVPVRIESVRILDETGVEVEEIMSGAAVIIEVIGTANEHLPSLNLGVEISRVDGVVVYDVNSRMDGYIPAADTGRFSFQLHLPHCSLADGVYAVNVGLMDGEERFHYTSLSAAAHLCVRDSLPYRGIARLGHLWNFEHRSGPAHDAQERLVQN